MFSLMPWKKKETTNGYRNGGALTPVTLLRNEFDRVFDRFYQSWPSLWEGFDAGWGLDVHDQGDSVQVRVEAPGFEVDDFDLQISGNTLHVRASRKAEDKDNGFQRWSQSELHRSVTLPSGIDPNKVEARYKNGVLSLDIPKTPEAKPKRIAIKS